MVEITKGSLTLTVTKGAYKTIYAPQDWVLKNDPKIIRDDFSGIIEKNNETIQDEKENVPELKSDDSGNESDDEPNLSEIPLSAMTVPQLKLYAKQLGIEVNTDSARQLRTQIKKVLEG